MTIGFAERRSRDFAERIRPHAAALLRYARRSVVPRTDAADVLQAAFASAFEAHDRFDPESSFKAWIYRFTTHEVLNHNRRARHRAHRGLPELDGAELGADQERPDLELELAYEAVLADPDAVLAHLETPVVTALETLPPQMRAAFLLRSLADFNCAEIATVLEVPKGTVLSWLFRARERLRRELARYARSSGFRIPSA